SGPVEADAGKKDMGDVGREADDGAGCGVCQDGSQRARDGGFGRVDARVVRIVIVVAYYHVAGAPHQVLGLTGHVPEDQPVVGGSAGRDVQGDFAVAPGAAIQRYGRNAGADRVQFPARRVLTGPREVDAAAALRRGREVLDGGEAGRRGGRYGHALLGEVATAVIDREGVGLRG